MPASPQTQTDGPTLTHVSPQPLRNVSVSAIKSTSSPSGDYAVASPCLPPQEDVAGGEVKFASKSTKPTCSGQSRPSTPQHKECGPVHQVQQADYNNERPLPSCEPHTNMSQPPTAHHAQSLPQQSSAAPPHHSLPHALTLGHCQVERVSPPEHQLEQPFSNRDLTHSPIGATAAFYQAHDFIIKDPVFIDSNSNSDNFMASLFKETIPGAEFDSSDPNMPARCHPGTRLEVIKQCQDFVLNREGRPKLRWVVGAAGVGKSAVMQSVAHDELKILSVAAIIVGATVFFSINGRQDGTKALTTIAYQLAVKLHSYRRFVQREVTNDPSLLRKSLAVQFGKFIVEPFVYHRIPDCPSRLLIIIDGLNECANPSTQLELLGIISKFCASYPDSPLVWMIASRPERHIAAYFSHPAMAPLHEIEQILVDSGDGRDSTLLGAVGRSSHAQYSRTSPLCSSNTSWNDVSMLSGNAETSYPAAVPSQVLALQTPSGYESTDLPHNVSPESLASSSPSYHPSGPDGYVVIGNRIYRTCSSSSGSQSPYQREDPESEIRCLRKRVKDLEAIIAATPGPSSPANVPQAFRLSLERRTEARKSVFCSLNLSGNALCAWHDSRRERRKFPPRNAPAGMLNCGCSHEEALFEESLARHGVGGYLPGASVRMDPELRAPLLRLLQDRYGYKDGDFDYDPQTLQWHAEQDAESWERRAPAGSGVRTRRTDHWTRH